MFEKIFLSFQGLYQPINVTNAGAHIDLVLIDPQSVGKRTYNLMDTVNAKRDGRPFAGVSINI
jgi:hypothetical protein